MSYNAIQYFAVFLPVVILLYQLMHKRYRWVVLLGAGYVFFCMFSGYLVVYNIAVVIVTYIFAYLLENISVKNGKNPAGKKKLKTRKKLILAAGIIMNLSILIVLKYTGFFGTIGAAVLSKFGVETEFEPVRFLIPIGISYYTLQSISYLVDIYRNAVKKQDNIAKLALYLSFFPTIVEGPITRYGQISDALYSNESISYNNLTEGYKRILWGLFKKVVLADHMVIGVNRIFDSGVQYGGAVYVYGAVLCTLQLYMDFAGTIDIIIGTGRIFGIVLPENFKQPFFAKNAGDFWHRWHITLGTFFKDYIFFPISFSKPMGKTAKKVKKLFGMRISKLFVPTIALFCVWICNGLWHGPQETYIFYGMYYFVIILIENCMERTVTVFMEKHRLTDLSVGIRMFRFVKLFVIVVVGEMFFRAETISQGMNMLKIMITDFDFMNFIHSLADFVLEPYDYLIILIGMIIVLIVDILNEKHISVIQRINQCPKTVRWAIWYASIFIIIIFGAYGPGFDTVAMMYAAF
ncbi:MAG: MBOAT family O-acyltransferase [Eubacteriales bacterium]|nr:MBOAT family O-acyltransferase [Eubacteriales bacterium]